MTLRNASGTGVSFHLSSRQLPRFAAVSTLSRVLSRKVSAVLRPASWMKFSTPRRCSKTGASVIVFGYVVVEGQSRLLDWGVCSSRQKDAVSDVLVRKRLRRLLELWRPAVLVFNTLSSVTPKSNHRSKRLLKQIETEARKHRIPVRILEDNPVGSQGESLTKYENARRVAEHFPVLTRELPPKRRAWESEHYRMSIFTAASLVRVYLSSFKIPLRGFTESTR